MKNRDWHVPIEEVDEGEEWDIFVVFIVVTKFGFDSLSVKFSRVDNEILNMCSGLSEVDLLLFISVVRSPVVRCTSVSYFVDSSRFDADVDNFIISVTDDG